ncbi:MAG: amidohydrolase family protein [Clostridia bacterium]|nr:amidohydrolase family protein [Clostridia bacterium]
MKIFDAHCHIYPEKIARAASDGIGKFYDMKFDKIGTVERLVRKGDEAGVSMFLVHSVSTTPMQVASINKFIAGSVADHPDRMVGFGTMHPASEDYVADIENIIELGLKGVKLHPDFQQFALDSDEAYKLCKVISDYKLPVLVHTGDPRFKFSNPDQTRVILERLPDLKFIGAHFGGWSVWEEAVTKLSGYSNMWVDSSSTMNWVDAQGTKDMIHAFGAERVFFGSDYPMWPVDVDVERFKALGLSAEEEEKILWSNIVNFLNLDL